GLGSRPVYLIGQDHVGKNGPRFELEQTGLLIEDFKPDDVRRQQVRGELDALERAVKAPCDCLRECGLAYAGDILDQQMAPGQQGDQGELDYLGFTSDDAFYCRLELF